MTFEMTVSDRLFCLCIEMNVQYLLVLVSRIPTVVFRNSFKIHFKLRNDPRFQLRKYMKLFARYKLLRNLKNTIKSAISEEYSYIGKKNLRFVQQRKIYRKLSRFTGRFTDERRRINFREAPHPLFPGVIFTIPATNTNR